MPPCVFHPLDPIKPPSKRTVQGLRKKGAKPPKGLSHKTSRALDFLSENAEHKLELIVFATNSNSRAPPNGISNRSHFKQLVTSFSDEVLPRRHRMQTGISAFYWATEKGTRIIPGRLLGNLFREVGGLDKIDEIDELTTHDTTKDELLEQLENIKREIDDIINSAGFPKWCHSPHVPLEPVPSELWPSFSDVDVCGDASVSLDGEPVHKVTGLM
tara:strand:- start:97 stop:741 length:645 start_codon:yes stop_codon:yes gene_type:complete